MLAAVAAAGCGDTGSLAVPRTSTDSASIVVPATTASRAPAGSGSGAGRAASGPAIPSGYAGLGAPAAAFARAHQESARGRGRGVPLISGVAVGAGGRVTAYDVQFNDRPPRSDYERLVAATGVSDLPRDRVTVTEGVNCLVFGSPSLKRLIGVAYTRVTTTRRTATAAVRSIPNPTC